ncbi:LacI family DNA-binding transcriptional regulator [Variovorax sp. Sphag1AA]|uniref:LacI family DNA-binding transcriptional regulator n=1 Tax=Variovorax sp. Sphag1AA TaxID=2587027 RepID=UPI001614B77D|nr:LacI family DNA-binding transcriptional regulator [Variovorax sp. Sphag1AA]MBB3178755.1 DNA-binding LacI/PurR family transcriptional regulator [Variovorax sp. Sphag1AA]
MTTIQDVARHAEVSVSTVSNVLNGRVDRMRPDTLARVRTSIEALQFRPSKLAQQLKTGQTPLLGLLVPSLTNPMYGHIAREVETAAQQRHGFRLLIGSTYRDREKESAFFEDLLAHGVRRVIVISSLADERHFESAVERGMVVISYDRGATPGRRSRVGHVMPDNFEAARMATAHLIAKGHRHLAFATVAGLTMSRSAKIDGFHAAAEAVGLAQQAQVIDGGALNEYSDAVIAEVGRAMAARLARMKQRPTGVVALNDLMAFGLMAGLRDLGVRVPQDISIVGIDGLYLSGLSNPALSTVELPVHDMAQAMVEQAMARSEDEWARERVFVPRQLLERESVAAPPRAAPRSNKPRAAEAKAK